MNRRTLPGVAALTLTAALALASCSSGGASNPADTPMTTASTGGSGAVSDACSLLTSADIAGVIDSTYGAAKHNDKLSNAGQDICEWFSSNGPTTFIQVLVVPGGDQLASQRDSASQAMGAATDVTVPGASGAYTVASGSILGMAVGNNFIQVSNSQSTQKDLSQQTIALATIVAGNA